MQQSNSLRVFYHNLCEIGQCGRAFFVCHKVRARRLRPLNGYLRKKGMEAKRWLHLSFYYKPVLVKGSFLSKKCAKSLSLRGKLRLVVWCCGREIQIFLLRHIFLIDMKLTDKKLPLREGLGSKIRIWCMINDMMIWSIIV